MKNLVLFASIFSLLCTSSCNDVDPATVVLTVVDQDQNPLQGAMIELDCVTADTNTNSSECKDSVAQQGITNALGEATFTSDFDQVLKAEIAAVATDTAGMIDSLKNDAFIEFKVDEVKEYTITLYPTP